MKKVLILISVFILFLVLPNKEIEAASSSPYDIESVLLPRFAYDRYNDGNDNIYSNDTLAFRISTQIPNEIPEITALNLELHQIKYNGDYVRTLGYSTADLVLYGNVYSDTVAFTSFSNILWIDDLVFYRVVLGNVVVYSGALMTNPDTTNYSPVGTSEVFIEDDLTNADNEYQVVHYRFNTDIELQGQEKYIQFRDMYDGLIKDSISTDILNVLQIGVLADTVQNRNAYFIVDFDGGLPPALQTDYKLLDDLTEASMIFNFDPSVYLLQTASSGGVVDALSPTLWIKAIEEDVVVNLTISNILPDENTTMYVDFNKLEVDIYRCYETVIASDDSNNYFDQDDVEASLTSLSFSYPINTDVLGIDDTATIRWILYPQNVALSGGNPADYKIDLQLSYTVVEKADAIDGFIGTFGVWGWTDGEGGLIITLLIALIANAGLIFLKISSKPVYLIVNIIVLIITSLTGLLDLWFIIGYSVIIALGFAALISTGGE